MGGDDVAADASRARASRAKAGGSQGAGSARMEGGWRMRAEDGRSAAAGYGAAGGMRGRVWPRAVARRMRAAEHAPEVCGRLQY